MIRFRLVFPLTLALSVHCGNAQPSQPLPDQPQPPSRPFPQHASYRQGAILPSHISRQELDDSVRSFYDQWKAKYIRKSCVENETYVWFQSNKTEDKQSVSEGQGYGMLITALMAGYDNGAQATFDGLYRYFKSHPGRRSPYLMAWAQLKDCSNVDGTTATDGDLDIAYSLLLADSQWSRSGSINYNEEALRMIEAIRQQEINQQTFSVLLGNSVENDSKDYFDMRSSDFMPDHLRAFLKVSGDASWKKVIDNNYRLFRYLEDTYSPQSGLVPDFINKISIPSGSQGAAIHAIPARPHYLESAYDGNYSFNACRMPWRIAADYLLYGDPRAAALLTRLNRWIRSTTGDKPDNISAGYTLAGEDLPKHNFEALCFIAPFTVSAMISKDNQPWLNKCWDYLTRFPMAQFDYYDNSIKMIDMIILSGNYWAPAS